MNHRDAEDAEEVQRKKVPALATQRAIRIDRQSNKGLVENNLGPLRALCLCGSNYLTNCFISIYHSVALHTSLYAREAYRLHRRNVRHPPSVRDDNSRGFA